jgi:hypothetical protein
MFPKFIRSVAFDLLSYLGYISISNRQTAICRSHHVIRRKDDVSFLKTLVIRSRCLLPVTAGLATAQTIAFFFVWHANLTLADRVQALQAAGWLAIPSGPAAAALKTFGAAFWGGLFFTLSVGSGLTLATVALLFLWRRFFTARRVWLLPGALIWAAALIAVNLDGPTLVPTLFVGCTPLATALAAVQWRSHPAGPPSSPRRWYLPLITLLLLILLWSTQLNRELFTAIRDHLLLSNAAGRQVNDFYYRYTLFAAQAFKSFEQKTLRTCHLEPDLHPQTAAAWVDLLARYDVLPVPKAVPADVRLHFKEETLRLVSPNGAAIEADQVAFRRDPRLWLRRFSEAVDRYGPFRRMALMGLLVGFPILLYILVDGGIGGLAGLIAKADAVVWIRSSVCLAIGVVLLIPLLISRGQAVSEDQIGQALSADAWPRRVAALRRIEEQRMDLGQYAQYRHLLASPWVVERYWLARALGSSRHPSTYPDLLRLTQDPHPNVVCQAYYALGQRGQRTAVKAIEAQMVQSDHWYTQWYGYRAMRRLGWHQTRSTSGP